MYALQRTGRMYDCWLVILSPRLVVKACEIIQALVGIFSEIQLCSGRTCRVHEFQTLIVIVRCFLVRGQSFMSRQESTRQYEECRGAFIFLRDSISGDSNRRALTTLSPIQVREEDDDYLLAKHALLLYLNSI